MNAFFGQRRSAATWHSVGQVSDFPDASVESHDSRIARRCRAFTIPKQPDAAEPMAQVEDIDQPGEMKEQVLVFKYKDKIHAIDHQCPHSSFPLSQGRVFDIEDFGIVLSAGIMCPKHDWSFDIFSGRSDRGTYKLNVWEVKTDDSQVWVRRKQRIG
ncbi:Rieske domain-containing protein [Acrodontium crateriforme]|uniref:Rieske domain-containing protein n=1 Tax=Acrodontium crateriforme TaxID=150365 RepID=A0AAQ3MBJ2_9PEZI|nr:Rieske domain-containing protein [Acrodontium crateriforme]